MAPSQLITKQWLLVEALAQGKFFEVNDQIIHDELDVKSIVFLIQPQFSDAVSEVWDLADEKNKVIAPSLPRFHYSYGIALFPVNSDFCRK